MDIDSVERDKPGIVAFFSIGISYIAIKPEVSSNNRRKLNVMLKKPIVPCYVLEQLGKNDAYREDILGSEIIEHAMRYLKSAHKIVGGRFVRIDCKDNKHLISFYERNGFEFIQKNEEGDPLQFMRRLDTISDVEGIISDLSRCT